MSNPFARSKHYLPSINRHGITAWAHDIIDELQRIGILNPGNENAADDLFRVYQNVLQFYSWVSTRPRIHVIHAQRPIQAPWTPNDIFASAHKVWNDLEWELRSEKDGAFIDQMIDHLGWFWNVKKNLVNQARHTRGFSVLPSMATLAEAANYARISSIDRANIMQSPVSRTMPSGSHFPRPIAPASRDNPRNVEVFPAGYITRRRDSRDNAIHPSRTYLSGIPSMLQPETGHLQLLEYSQSVQEQPHSAMPITLSVKSKQSLNLQPGVNYRPPTARDKPSHNVFDMAGDKYDDGIEYSQTSRVPVGLILPAPEIRDNRYPNRAQGFGGGSKRPMTIIPAVKPGLSGRDNHRQDLPTSHDGQLAQSHTGIIRNKTENRFSDIRKSVSTPKNDVIVISDTPSPESTTTSIESLRSKCYGRHLISSALSPEDKYEVERSFSVRIPPVHSRDTTRHYIFPVNPAGPRNRREVKSAEADKIRSESFDRRSTRPGCDSTEGEKQEMVANVGVKKFNATENDLDTPNGNKSTFTIGNQRNMKVNNIGKDNEVLSSSINLNQNDGTYHLQKVNAKMSEPINTISANQKKKPKISGDSTASSPDHASPYAAFRKQYQPRYFDNAKSSRAIKKSAEDKRVENKDNGGRYNGEKTASMNQKSTDEDLVSDKSINVEISNEESIADELIAEASVMEDAMSKNISPNKLASEESVSNKPFPAKVNKSKSLYRPFSMR